MDSPVSSLPSTRHFLGWDDMPLERAADWLARRFGGEQGNLIIALPGARAGRLLLERLSRELGPAWSPPRVVTAGTLTDALLEVERPSAPRLARTLAWARVLSQLPAAELARISAEPPGGDDLRGWMRLAGEIRGLFGELAAEGTHFQEVAEGPAAAGGAGELGRWRALARAQEQMRAELTRQGWDDPHLARLDALAAGRIREGYRVVLVGVTELNRMTRSLLAHTGAEVLVFAPQSLEETFDEWGTVRAAAWRERPTSLDAERWLVAEGPQDQARAGIEALARFERGPYRPEEVTIGVARPEVIPYLRRRLAQEGITARDVAGIPARESAPARLLAALVEYLERGRFSAFTALLRQTDLERALRGLRPALAQVSLPAAADPYHGEHVPFRLGEPWGELPGDRRDRERLLALRSAHDALTELLGELGEGEARPLSTWAQPLRRFLGEVFEEAPLAGAEDEGERRLAEALRALGEILAEIEALSQAAREVTAAQAVGLVLDLFAERALPPPPTRAGRATLDLLGWMELPLDDAPALVVTGFDEGFVPEPLGRGAWLPESARAELGLVDGDQRLARDNYITELLLHSRREVAFVSGRRTREGESVFPSRIALLCDEKELPGRIARALAEGDAQPSATHSDPVPHRPVFAPGLGEEPHTWSPSAFADYLVSPHYFWVRRIARRETWDDTQRELDARVFGNLTHEVLDAFARSSLAASNDPQAIARFLIGRLRGEARTRFGEHPYPAVHLQLAQLEVRLARFAEAQARWVDAGWRIVESEWEPTGAVTLDIPGGAPARLTGRIDRIDRHEAHGFAILDYKTADRGKNPTGDHRKKSGEWKKLQLPLYRLLAVEVTGDDAVELGYVNLAASEAESGFKIAKWKEEDLAEATREAQRIVGEVRETLAAGRPFEDGNGKLYAWVYEALAGRTDVARR